jgi:hypothetical protein
MDKRINFPSTYVFFDDALFSGEQMIEQIQKIFGHIMRENLSKTLPQIPVPKCIIIACAYMTNFGEKALQDFAKRQKFQLIIMSHANIPTVDESIQDKG